MARYDHLPLYKSVYTLCRETFRLQEKLPKTLRFSLGTMTTEATFRCLRGIILANGSVAKAKPLQVVALEVEVLWTYYRMLYDFKAISSGEFQILSERLADIGQQLSLWKKWDKAQPKEKVDKK